MTTLVEKTRSQRKTFTLPNYIVKDLEKYAAKYEKKQSQIIALALEEFLQKENSKVGKRLEALDALIGIAPSGSLKDLDLKQLRVKNTLDA